VRFVLVPLLAASLAIAAPAHALAPDAPSDDDPPTSNAEASPAEPEAGAPPPTSSPAPAAEPQTAATPPASPSDTAAPAPPATVHVHVEAVRPGRSLELFEVTEETLGRGMGSGDVRFRRVCPQPCDIAVPASAEYFLASGKNTQSRKFTIDGHGDRVLVRARPGSRAAGIVGEVLIAVGAMLIVSGTGMIVAGELLDRRKFVLAGAGMLGGGLGGLAIGIPLELVAGHVRVRHVGRAGASAR